MLLNTERIVATAIELAFDTLEVADTGKCYANELLEELVHTLTTRRTTAMSAIPCSSWKLAP